MYLTKDNIVKIIGLGFDILGAVVTAIDIKDKIAKKRAPKRNWMGIKKKPEPLFGFMAKKKK
jgi:hypothetical protein